MMFAPLSLAAAEGAREAKTNASKRRYPHYLSYLLCSRAMPAGMCRRAPFVARRNATGDTS